MSLIAGMPEVIAYIRSQDERIKSLEDENKKLKEQNEELELTEENAIQYVYDNSSKYEDWVKGSTVYQELKAEMDNVKETLKAYWSGFQLGNADAWYTPDSWRDELEVANQN